MPKHKGNAAGTGLRRIGHTPWEARGYSAVRGMVNAVSFMVKVEGKRCVLNTLSPAERLKGG